MALTVQASPANQAMSDLMELKKEVFVSLEANQNVKACDQVGKVFEKAIELKKLLRAENRDESEAREEMHRAETYLTLYCAN